MSSQLKGCRVEVGLTKSRFPDNKHQTMGSQPFLFLALILSIVSAFAPLSQKRSAFRLFAYDDYQPGEMTELFWKDTAVGEGDAAENGDILTVGFTGKVMQTNVEFVKNEGDFVFELGAGESLPGFDVGLVNAQAGTTRLLRVPPNLAFGENGASRVPPNSDLEIEVEVKGVARGQFAGLLAKIGTGRLITGLFLLAILAVSPML